jgi:hypothetical protein
MMDEHSLKKMALNAKKTITIASENYSWDKETEEFIDTARGEGFARTHESDYYIRVKVYEDRVMNWFLNLAKDMVKKKDPHDYIALSVGLAYIEGVERYRRGATPQEKDEKSGDWFKEGAERIFGKKPKDKAVKLLYDGARNGLFHTGFTDLKIYLSHDVSEALEYSNDKRLDINPKLFIDAIIKDFELYIQELYKGPTSDKGKNFIEFWNKIWERS